MLCGVEICWDELLTCHQRKLKSNFVKYVLHLKEILYGWTKKKYPVLEYKLLDVANFSYRLIKMY